MGVITVDELAVHGGPPVRTKPWVSKYMGSEELGAEEKARVMRVLEKKRIFRYLPTGIESSEASALEEEYKAFLGTDYAGRQLRHFSFDLCFDSGRCRPRA